MPDSKGFSLCLRGLILGGAVSLLLLGGCATNGNPRDPFEPLNRGIYKFNDGIDHLIVKPAAEIYRGVLPDFLRTGISNAFSNINDVIVALNNLLQGKLTNAALDVSRIAVNTTVGVLGIFDVATEIGLERHNEDFGQTLGYWGFGDGPYIVLPLLGPSSVRDTVGWVGDIYAWPITYVEPNRDRNALTALRFVGQRAELLQASRILETAALDPYEFVRDAYLQRRRNQVYDGNPPDEDYGATGANPRPEHSGPFPFPAISGKTRNTVLLTGDAVATPAEIEARRRASHSHTPPSSPLPHATAPAEFKPTPARVVRVWLPGARN